jgi:hypothetical protein
MLKKEILNTPQLKQTRASLNIGSLLCYLNFPILLQRSAVEGKVTETENQFR